jgi:hypothetical protein
MAEALRKALNSSVAYLSSSFGLGHGSLAVTEDIRLGEYCVDYTMPSREELEATDRELGEG